MTNEEAIKVITTLLYNQTGVMCDDQREGVFMAVDALEKQIPKHGKIKNSFTNKCECDASIYPHMKYCSRCGQAIDWSDDK